jgi:hypothetical protein
LFCVGFVSMCNCLTIIFPHHTGQGGTSHGIKGLERVVVISPVIISIWHRNSMVRADFSFNILCISCLFWWIIEWLLKVLFFYSEIQLNVLGDGMEMVRNVLCQWFIPFEHKQLTSWHPFHNMQLLPRSLFYMPKCNSNM